MIQQEWLDFSADTLDPDIDLQEMRRAFFTGAQCLLNLVFRNLSPDREPTREDIVIMTNLHTELQQFYKDLQAGKA